MNILPTWKFRSDMITVCPYCGSEDLDQWEFLNGPGYMCKNCGLTIWKEEK